MAGTEVKYTNIFGIKAAQEKKASIYILGPEKNRWL
jgi:hypothetical protein